MADYTTKYVFTLDIDGAEAVKKAQTYRQEITAALGGRSVNSQTVQAAEERLSKSFAAANTKINEQAAAIQALSSKMTGLKTALKNMADVADTSFSHLNVSATQTIVLLRAINKEFSAMGSNARQAAQGADAAAASFEKVARATARAQARAQTRAKKATAKGGVDADSPEANASWLAVNTPDGRRAWTNSTDMAGAAVVAYYERYNSIVQAGVARQQSQTNGPTSAMNAPANPNYVNSPGWRVLPPLPQLGAGGAGGGGGTPGGYASGMHGFWANQPITQMINPLQQLTQMFQLFNNTVNQATMQVFGLRRLGYGLSILGTSMQSWSKDSIAALTGVQQAYLDFNQVATRAALAMELPRPQQRGLEDTVMETSQKLALFKPTEIAEGLRLWAAGTGTVVNTMEDLNNVLSKTTAIQQVAIINDVSLGESMSTVGNAVNEFGLRLEDTQHVTELMNYVAAKTFANITDVGQAFRMVGPIAHQLGVSIEEVTAMFGLLADSGIKGSQAGRAVRQVFMQLGDPSKETVASLNLITKANASLGQSWRDIVFPKGEFIGAARFIDLLAASTSKMTDAERQNILATISTANELPALTALVAAQTEARTRGSNAILERMADEGEAAVLLQKQWTTASTSISFQAEQSARRIEVAQQRIGRSVSVGLVPLQATWANIVERFGKTMDNIPAVGTIAKGVYLIASAAGVVGKLVSTVGNLVSAVAAFYIMGHTWLTMSTALKASGLQFSQFVGLFGLAVKNFMASQGVGMTGATTAQIAAATARGRTALTVGGAIGAVSLVASVVYLSAEFFRTLEEEGTIRKLAGSEERPAETTRFNENFRWTILGFQAITDTGRELAKAAAALIAARTGPLGVGSRNASPWGFVSWDQQVEVMRLIRQQMLEEEMSLRKPTTSAAGALRRRGVNTDVGERLGTFSVNFPDSGITATGTDMETLKKGLNQYQDYLKAMEKEGLDYQKRVKKIDEDFAKDELDAKNSLYKAIERAMVDFNENEAKIERDHARQLARAKRDFDRAEAKAAKDVARSLAKLDEDQLQAEAKAQASAVKAQRELEERAAQDQQELERRYAQQQIDDAKSLQRALEDAQREHSRRVLELVESRDVPGLVQEFRNYRYRKEDIQREAEQTRQDRAAEYEQDRQDLLDKYAQERQDLLDKQAQDTLDRAADREVRRQEILQQAAEDRQQRLDDFNLQKADQAAEWEIERQDRAVEQQARVAEMIAAFEEERAMRAEKHATDLADAQTAHQEQLAELKQSHFDQIAETVGYYDQTSAAAQVFYADQLKKLAQYLDEVDKMRTSRLPRANIPELAYDPYAIPGMSAGGYATKGKYNLGEQGREFVLNANTVRNLENAMGPLTQGKVAGYYSATGSTPRPVHMGGAGRGSGYTVVVEQKDWRLNGMLSGEEMRKVQTIAAAEAQGVLEAAVKDARQAIGG